MHLKIMTYNIQHGRNHNLPGDVIDFDNTATPILQEKPDILGLNEVRNGNAEGYVDQPAVLADLCGGTPIFGKAFSFGEGKDYGNAILSKFPVLSYKTVPIPDPAVPGYDGYYEPRAVLCATISCGTKELCVLSAHFGLNPDEQENAVNTILKLIDEIDTPIICMGDFNVTPDDVAIKRLSLALHNTAADLNTIECSFSSDYPCECIDYIFYRGLTPLKIHTVKEIYSDHFPLIAEFDF